jgi:hypothetical protein
MATILLQTDTGSDEAGRAYLELERRAIAWTARSLSYFDPDGISPSERTFARKALAELALLLVYRVRLDPAPLEADYLAALAHLERVFARRSYREAIARDHRSFLLYAFAYAALKLCGRATPDYDWLVAQALDARLPVIFERIPYRQLDLLHFLHLIGAEHRGRSCADVFPQTLLAGRPNVVEVKDDDAYAITHALFYMTDFGLRHAEWTESFDVGDAAELVAALMRRYLMLGNADLTAELVASALCLGVRATPEIDEAWRILHAAQQPDGRIAGPAGFVDEARAEELGGPAYREWITSYHTTMVAALAALMARRAAHNPTYPCIQLGTATQPEARRVHQFDRCRRALGAARQWLGDQLQGELAHAIHAAAGLALCVAADSLTAQEKERLAALVIRIDAESEDELPWVALGADTTLWAALCFQRAGRASRTLDAWLDYLARNLTLAELPDCPEAYAACRLLSDLGKLDRPSLAATAARMRTVDPSIQSGETGHEFATRLLQATGADRNRLANEVIGPSTAARLTSDLIQACQDYRLGEAAVLLRTLIFVGRGGERVACDTVMYLLSQQRPDGAFGYFARDEAESTLKAAHLAWTTGAVWALVDFVGAA